MPQLDFHNPMTIFQVVWMFAIFGVLYLLLAKWALPNVARVVDARVAHITADLDAAKAARTKAEAAVLEVRQAIRNAHTEAGNEIASALAGAKVQAAQRAHALNVALDQQIATAEARIAEARTAAMGALRQIATETAGLLVAKVTGRPADQAALAAAVDHSVASVG